MTAHHDLGYDVSMDSSQQRVARAHVLGLVGLSFDVLLILVAVSLAVAQMTGALTLSYWPAFPALAAAALLIGVPAGALLGWANKQRQERNA